MGFEGRRKPRRWLRVAYGTAAVVLGDVILGLASFSVITLASLWYFSLGWIRLVQEYGVRGVSFGSSTQLDLAWFGAVVSLPMVALTVYLAIRAFRIPRQLLRGPTTPGAATSL
jgi:hypothetical protein